MNVNANKIEDDLLLYYYMTVLNNMVVINSSEHINLLIIPQNGITSEQESRLDDINAIFTGDINWSLAYQMHIETYEDDGIRYGYLDVGDTFDGKLNDTITKYKSLKHKNKN